MDTAISKLARLGFTNYEAKAYTTLLKEHPLTAYEIAKNSGIPSSKIYEVIRKLEHRNTIQSIHSKNSKLFIPLSPDEFVQNFRLTVEDNLQVVSNALKGFKVGINASYTWHINSYDDMMVRAQRMIRTARNTILLLTWPDELSRTVNTLHEAREQQTKIAIVHYGATNIKIGQIYQHPVNDTIYAEKGVRGFTLVTDSREALIGKINDEHTEAIWSMNEVFVMNAEDYLRHDIYMLKILRRFNPKLKEIFGENYEGLVNIYDEEKV